MSGAEKKKGPAFKMGPLVEEIKEWAVWIGLAVILSFVIGNVLNIALGNTTPLVAVMSGSMVHDATLESSHYSYLSGLGFSRSDIDAFPLKGGFNKGDVLVIKGERQETLKIGDVIVFNAPGAHYPIIHRLIGVQKDSAGAAHYRTKGDHNPQADPWLTPYKQVQGRAVLRIPFIGYAKVIPLEFCTSIGFCARLFGG